MGADFYTGVPGSGKSYHCAQIIYNELRKGKDIIFPSFLNRETFLWIILCSITEPLICLSIMFSFCDIRIQSHPHLRYCVKNSTHASRSILFHERAFHNFWHSSKIRKVWCKTIAPLLFLLWKFRANPLKPCIDENLSVQGWRTGVRLPL